MFNLIQIGRKALMANQLQLQVTGENIANVNTEGYSRKRVSQSASDPTHDALSYYGTGVETSAAVRMRDLALDDDYRRENSLLGFWDSTSTALSELETELDEPSDYGLTSRLTSFWDSWEALTDDPTDTASRQDILETAAQLTDSFHEAATSVSNKRADINERISDCAGSINQIAAQLASLNTRIDQANQQGTPANDLEDSFDQLLDQLSEYGEVSVQHRTDGDGTVIYLGSDELVKSDQYRTLEARSVTKDGKTSTSLDWTDTHSEIAGLQNGKLAGLTHTRDDLLDSYSEKLDRIAVSLAKAVNDIHVTGYGVGSASTSNGRNFFDPEVTGAADLEISSDVLDHPEAIAASQAGSEGDNRVALKMAGLRTASVIDGQSITNALGGLFSRIGSDSQAAAEASTTRSNTSTQVDNLRESVKGVSLDEEAANLLQYQKSYQAAAKVIAAADTLLDTVMSLVD
jgi:flagellar hook-associated protein 1